MISNMQLSFNLTEGVITPSKAASDERRGDCRDIPTRQKGWRIDGSGGLGFAMFVVSI